MKKRWAKITLGVVAAVFLMGILDISFSDPSSMNVPEGVVSLAAVILSGVAVALIVAGIRNGNGGGGDHEE